MGLNLGTYKIRDSHRRELPQAIWSIKQGNYYLILLTETKILDMLYCRNCLGYKFVFSKAAVAMTGVAPGGGRNLVAGETGGVD